MKITQPCKLTGKVRQFRPSHILLDWDAKVHMWRTSLMAAGGEDITASFVGVVPFQRMALYARQNLIEIEELSRFYGMCPECRTQEGDGFDLERFKKAT